jgi:hypothetical protein
MNNNLDQTSIPDSKLNVSDYNNNIIPLNVADNTNNQSLVRQSHKKKVIKFTALNVHNTEYVPINVLGFILTILLTTILLLIIQILSEKSMFLFLNIIYLIIGVIILLITYDNVNLRVLLIIYLLICILFFIIYAVINRSSDNLSKYGNIIEFILIAIISIITTFSLII